MARYVVVIFVGLSIDALQALLSAGLFGLGSLISTATLGVAAPVALPFTAGLALALGVTVSATFGSGLMLLLAYNGMFYPKYAFSGGIAELMPGIDIVPAWTLTTILAVRQKIKDEKKKAESASASTTSVRGGFGSTHASVRDGFGSTRQTVAQTRSRSIYKLEEGGGQEASTSEQQPRQSFSSVRLVDGITASRSALPASEPLNYAR